MTSAAGYTLGGWLLKQGPKGPKFWKNRFFALWNDSELHYSASDQNMNPQTSLGYIDLRSVTSAESEDKNSTENRFVFYLKTPERTYVLAAASDAERAYWLLRIGVFVRPAKEVDPCVEIKKLQIEISKLRSDIDFESQKNSMQIGDLRKQIEAIKKEKDKEIQELKEIVRRLPSAPVSINERSSRHSMAFK
jgi:hypothetical protein